MFIAGETHLMGGSAGAREVILMSDQVPEKYRGIFTNEEWVQHQFVVWGSWIFVGMAFVVHMFIIAGGKTYLPKP
jgi:hypothetical protein